jgi:nitrile hydratase alpha subunit
MGDTGRQLLARAWKDEGFRAKLQENPKEALAEFGLEVPADVKVTVHESTGSEKHLVIPENPGGGIATSLVQCTEILWTVGCTFGQAEADAAAALSSVECVKVLWTSVCTP